jgi:hypothetical protein
LYVVTTARRQGYVPKGTLTSTLPFIPQLGMT